MLDASSARRSMTGRRLVALRLGLALASTLFALGLVEGGLRFVEAKYMRLVKGGEQRLSDPLLGERVAPGTRGYDRAGFRNPVALDRAEIVVFGDSQTWGVNVSPAEAWPLVLAQRSGRTVYNMAIGGYGPVQYLVLTDAALRLSPRVLVVGIYFGNDLWDAYKIAYTLPAHADLTRPDLRHRIAHDTVGPRAGELWDEEKGFQQRYGHGSLRHLPLWLQGHTAIGRFLERSGILGRRLAFWEASRAWAEAHPDHGAVYDEPTTRTVLTTAYRLVALDLDEPRIAEGLRITCEVVRRIQRKCDPAGVRLLVVLIPTKEAVYADAVRRRSGHLNPTYERLVAMEGRARDRLIRTCEETEIPYLDILPIFRAALARGEALYPPDTESHPNAAGYRTLAAAVDDRLRQLGW